MKNKFSLLILITILILMNNCKKSNTIIIKNEVQFKLLNTTSKNEKLYIEAHINNNSNKKLYFPFNYQIIKFQSDLQAKYNTNALYALFFNENKPIYAITSHPYIIDQKKEDSIQKRKDSLLKLNTLLIKKEGNNKNGLWGLQYSSIKKNGFFIPPNSTLNLNIPITLINTIERNLIIGDISKYNMSDLRNSQIQLVIRIDSSEAKNLLLPKDLDSLKRNNIKIFHGTLYSNKVPLIVE